MNLIDKSIPAAPSATEPALPRIQTLKDLSPDQIRAIRRIPSHDQASPRAIDERRPASIFLDQDRFDLEQQNVFRKFAVPVTVSARLPRNGSVIAHDGYGVPLLISRDTDGKVRAFLNACTHKGSKLVEDCETHLTKKLTCPYHAWTFALDGRLVAVPREETIANFDKKERGLAELACREAGGIVWVMLDRNAEPDFRGMDDLLAADMEAFDLPRMHVYGQKTFDLAANWKLVQEPFLEGYHVQRLHARSVGPMFADVPNVTDVLGLNIRQISGKVNFTPECLDIDGENIHKSVTHAYLVFPNTVIVTSPYYISVMIIIPRGPGRTVVDYMMLTRGKADNEKAEDVYRRSYEMILNVFGNEDFRAAEISHAGLSSGAIRDVVYCGLEETIPLYYEILERFL
ncbi:aromatic ring-hydroxylating oxygenase subunit alpha [Hyphomonas sp. NPDC076900]|uniref:aromatic ring-hydroxylating oxygenase subunit alpha n=1 Tax=unclassified Hyphomonas TaxID=2630699 RepID=UPI003D0109A7